MQIFFGEQCPSHDWIKVGCDSCKYCQGHIATYDDCVDCSYSEVPTCEPKFAVGQEVWRLEGSDICWHQTIRKIDWNGYNWTYLFKRERTHFDEDRLFEKRQDAELAIIRNKAEHLLKSMKSYSERYHVPIADVQNSLLPPPKEEE